MRRTSLRVRGLLTAAAVCAGLLTGVAGASSAAASDAGTFVSSINAARRSAGLSALSSSSALSAVARSWAASMAAAQHLAHNPRLTSQVSSWRLLGENVGTGGSATAIHRAFMGSPAHRANILSSRYSQVGVGVVSGGGQLWVVEVFRLPTGATAASSTPKTARKPNTASTPKPKSQPQSTSSSRTTTTRSHARTSVTRPASTPAPQATRAVRKATKPVTEATSPARKAADPVPSPSRAATAEPAAAPAPPTLASVLEHVRLAMTASGDPVAAWAWLLRRLLGVRTTIGA